MNVGFNVIQPGLLSLVQDSGRFGLHGIGLTTGGPLDRNAFRWANRLCENPENSALLEVAVGGLTLESTLHTRIAVTGAAMPFSINKKPAALWQTHTVAPGDRIELGFASAGNRCYLAVAGGFQIDPVFNSVSTVSREGLGGLHGDGSALKSGDFLRLAQPMETSTLWQLDEHLRPTDSGNSATLRVILGYQHADYDNLQKQRFFTSEYRVTKNCDRMGYRLEGAAITGAITGILSEGICQGAIQIPADGQPIILLSDRQTIGGYPKLGSVLSLDLDRLAQLGPGGKVRFEPISIEQAHNLLLLAEYRLQSLTLTRISHDPSATQHSD